MADIHLYSSLRPMDKKFPVFLEAANIPYEASKIDILKNDQFTDDYIKINPNSKIPAIVDEGPTEKNTPSWNLVPSCSIWLKSMIGFAQRPCAKKPMHSMVIFPDG